MMFNFHISRIFYKQYVFQTIELSWENFFGESKNITNFELKEFDTSSQIDLSEYDQIHVSNSYFESFSNRCLYYSKDDGKLLLEFSSFLKCSTLSTTSSSTSNYGACLYIECESDCVISSVCAISCKAYRGQFCRTELVNK